MREGDAIEKIFSRYKVIGKVKAMGRRITPAMVADGGHNILNSCCFKCSNHYR